MLNEIDADTLAHVLNSVQAIVDLWPCRPSPRPSSSFDQFLLSLKRGDVIEIQGPPGTAKTHHLYYLLSFVITPSSHQGMLWDGWGKAAIVFDMDSTFDVIRLSQIVTDRLRRHLGSDSTKLHGIVKSCLERLHVFRPTSTVQLAISINYLQRYHELHLTTEEIGLVAIDPVSAHLWPDRLRMEQMRRTAEVTSLRRVLESLQTFRRTHGHITVLTSWSLHQTSSGKSGKEFAAVAELRPCTLYESNGTPFARPPLPLSYHITLLNARPFDEKSEDDIDDRMVGFIRRGDDWKLMVHYSSCVTVDGIYMTT